MVKSKTGADVAAEERPNATLTKSVYEQLRSDLLAGHFRPGEKLGAEVLRHRFQIGSSPIREALNRLLAEGFVSLEEQKGFRVAPVSEQELRELLMARTWIDGAAIRESLARYDRGWEEGLVLALYRLSRRERTVDMKSNAEWEMLHRDFHLALVSGCGTQWITRISMQLFDAAERYRLLAADHVPERNELDEHKAIVDACLAKEAEKAVDLLKLHYGRTFEVIVRSLNSKAINAPG